MTDHIGPSIADLLAGRLSPDAARECEAHVRHCADCAADVAFARELRDRALREGLRHVEPERVVALAAGAEPGDAERAHLASCARCRDEIAWASAAAPEETEEDPPSRRRFGHWAWVGIAAAATLAAFVLIPRGGDGDVRGLARIEPLPVRVSRSSPGAGSLEESRTLGLEAYARRDWPAARAAFERALALAPEHGEIRLYLGSTELLSGEAEAAARTLDRAIETATDPAVRDEAAWQRAQAALATGDAERARSIVVELAGRDGRRRDDAGALLRSLDPP